LGRMKKARKNREHVLLGKQLGKEVKRRVNKKKEKGALVQPQNRFTKEGVQRILQASKKKKEGLYGETEDLGGRGYQENKKKVLNSLSNNARKKEKRRQKRCHKLSSDEKMRLKPTAREKKKFGKTKKAGQQKASSRRKSEKNKNARWVRDRQRENFRSSIPGSAWYSEKVFGAPAEKGVSRATWRGGGQNQKKGDQRTEQSMAVGPVTSIHHWTG